MSTSQSTAGVLLALVANLAVAVAKLVAAAWTNSSAMMSEAIHSLVGIFSQALHFVGVRRSQRLALEAPAAQPAVQTRENAFWGFVAGVLLYSMGAGVSIYGGVQKLFDPQPLTDAHINYVVLAVAMCLVAVTTLRAVSDVGTRQAGVGLLDTVRHSKNVVLFTVVLKNIAAMAGLVIALAGVMASQFGGVVWADGMASVTIGLVMALVAVLMAMELRSLIWGTAIPSEAIARVTKVAEAIDADRTETPAANSGIEKATGLVDDETASSDPDVNSDDTHSGPPRSGNDRGRKAKKNRRR